MKTAVKIFGSIILGIIIVLLLIWLSPFNGGKSSSLSPDISSYVEKMELEKKLLRDSLLLEIKGLLIEIDSLKKETYRIDSIRIVIRDSIENLPPTEQVQILRKNIEEYERDFY